MTDFPPYVIEIIGALVVVGLLMIIFSGLSSAFIETVVNFENIKNFNKFTNLITTSCREGISTISYVSFSSYSTKSAIAIVNVGGAFASELRNTPICPNDTAVCTTSASKSRVNPCRESGGCWCLMRIDFNDGYCVNPEFYLLSIEKVSPWNDTGGTSAAMINDSLEPFREWDRYMVDELLNNIDVVKKVTFLQCKVLDKVCIDDRTGYPIGLSPYGQESFIVWLDPVSGAVTTSTYCDGFGCITYHSKIGISVFLDSMSIQRPIGNYGGTNLEEYYMDFYSHQNLYVVNFDGDTRLYASGDNCKHIISE